MIEGFFIPFATIFLAELFDKSQLSILLLSSEMKNRLQLWWGILCAFIIVDGTAVMVGMTGASYIDPGILKNISAVLFILFGIVSFQMKDNSIVAKRVSRNAFLAGLFLILIAEWGDKTQVVSAVFATQYTPWIVFIGVVSALGILSGITLYFGATIQKKVPQKIVRGVSGVLFLLLGVGTFLG